MSENFDCDPAGTPCEPRMDGLDAFLHLRGIRAGLPVILSSGFKEQEAIHGYLERGLAGFLRKPCTLQALREMVARALAAR